MSMQQGVIGQRSCPMIHAKTVVVNKNKRICRMATVAAASSNTEETVKVPVKLPGTHLQASEAALNHIAKASSMGINSTWRK